MDMAQFYGSFWVPWCSTETSCNGVVGIGCSGSSQLLQSWWMDQCSEPGQITEITELRLHMSRYSVTQRIAAEWTPITSNNCTAHPTCSLATRGSGNPRRIGTSAGKLQRLTRCQLPCARGSPSVSHTSQWFVHRKRWTLSQLQGSSRYLPRV